MQTACLCDTSRVLLLDEAMGAEGLLVGRLLNELLALPCGGSLRGEESLQVLPGLRAQSSLARTRLISSAVEVEEALPYSLANGKICY